MPLKLTSKQKEALTLLHTPATYILLYGGSRSGKTAVSLYMQLLWALLYPESRHLVARLHLSDLKSSVIYDTFPKIASLMNKQLGKYVSSNINKSDFFVKLPNGSSIWFTGLSDEQRSEKILGTEYSSIFIDEASQLDYVPIQRAITRCAQNIKGLKNRILFSTNPPNRSHWTYKLFVSNIDPIDNLKKNGERYAKLLMNPIDNPYLSSAYLDRLEDLSVRQRDRFKYGKWCEDIVGALWTQKLIDQNRTEKVDNFSRVVIGVDPAISCNKNSDETGIIVAALLDGICYILNDSSGAYTPNKWAEKVKFLYDKFEADRVICEINQGGDMVEHVLRSFDPNMSIKQVRAFKGKQLRAEPVVALYEQFKVKHTDVFYDLEDQMLSWIPNTKSSPDRIDALVYAVSELLLISKPISIIQL